MRRPALWGAVAVAAYLAAVLLLPSAVPFRPLFDGIGGLPPYRWVNPPPQDVANNQPPYSASFVLKTRGGAFLGATISTQDAQAVLIIDRGAFAPKEGQTGVKVQIRPLDPLTVGPPPAGDEYDGNAYGVEATYQPSGDPATLATQVTVILRFALFATVIVERDPGAGAWTPLKTDSVNANSQVFATTKSIGTFAMAVPASATAPPAPVDRGGRLLLFLSIGAAALGLVAGLVMRLRIMRRRGSAGKRPPSKRPPPKGKLGR